jgi:hypothetical protein
VLKKINPEAAEKLQQKGKAFSLKRFEYYQKLAALTYNSEEE